MKEKTFQEFDIPLHDIKPIVEVQEYSLYYLIALVVLGLLLISIIGYLLYKWYKKSKAFNLRKEYKEYIDKLDSKDTKNTAYAISTYGAIFTKDSPLHQEKYEKLTLLLQEYKYKKSVDAFDGEVVTLINEYRDMLHV